ncbi:hypothetical protein NPIL_169431 [Nephila pilipes]|uniref:RRM domain-containing protein n=1 Tax=Nephila pilipes TaxID=299642 RepID=A0A8X6U3E6_NEPPI|nr:hypothetical protein NPIL_169431 [Nephila pilipes]
MDESNNILRVQDAVYKFSQVNGQRKCGPPDGWNGFPPPKGCEVFIGKLPRDMYENELMPLLAQIGTVYELRLMMDFSGFTRGYAFVTYTNKEDAQKAIEVLDGLRVRSGKKIGAAKSVDNCKLCIGGIPTEKKDDEVYREIIKYTEGVQKVAFPKSLDARKNCGFALIDYRSHKYASMARRVLLGGDVRLFGKKISVNWADPEPDIDEIDLKEASHIFIFINLLVFIYDGIMRFCFLILKVRCS